jgi:hypothetical protein
MQHQPLETPPPFLSASIATTLYKSSGYICRGEITSDYHQEQQQQQVIQKNADGSFTVVESVPKQISSVKELLECQDIGGMKKLPGWATVILQECAKKEEQ